MSFEALKEKLPPLMDSIIQSGDMSESAIIALGAACSIMMYEGRNDPIRAELADAQKYLNKYLLTKDADYLQMAEDELSHARKPLIELKEKLHTGGEKALSRYESMLNRHDEILAAIRGQKRARE